MSARRLDDIHKRPDDTTSDKPMPSVSGSTFLDQLIGLSLEDEREDDDLGGRMEIHPEEDGDEDDFQLEVPAL